MKLDVISGAEGNSVLINSLIKRNQYVDSGIYCLLKVQNILYVSCIILLVRLKAGIITTALFCVYATVEIPMLNVCHSVVWVPPVYFCTSCLLKLWKVKVVTAKQTSERSNSSQSQKMKPYWSESYTRIYRWNLELQKSTRQKSKWKTKKLQN